MTDAQTIDVYDAKTEDYARMAEAEGRNLQFVAFTDMLPEAAQVLDLGCGTGRTAAMMVEMGMMVDAVDASAGMVAHALRNGVPARQATFDEIDGEAVYDGVWANFSLLHAPRAALPGHLARIHRALRPGGVLHLGMKLGTGEGRDSLGRFYVYYSEAELDGLLAQAGFTIDNRTFGHQKGLDGGGSDWIQVRAHA